MQFITFRSALGLLACGLVLSILLGLVRHLHQNWHTIPHTQFVFFLLSDNNCKLHVSLVLSWSEPIWQTIDLGSYLVICGVVSDGMICGIL